MGHWQHWVFGDRDLMGCFVGVFGDECWFQVSIVTNSWDFIGIQKWRSGQSSDNLLETMDPKQFAQFLIAPYLDLICS
jgi:hypothetical protein